LQIDGGNDLVGSSPAEFTEQIRNEMELYRKLIKDAGLQQQ